MSRFYVSPESVKDKKIYVEKKESHHIIDVMRLQEGDSVTAFDGAGKEYEGRIAAIKNKKVIIDIFRAKTVDKKLPVSVSIAQAMPKKGKMDLIIQKVTELGVDEIFPVESSRTVVKTKTERSRHKIERWQKIAIEASKQCGRTELPKVQDITYFDEMLACMDRYDLTIMPCLSEGTITLKSALKDIKRPNKVLVIIGPEGDFSKEEIKKASEKGAVLVTLGELILKSDTAAIATISVLNHEFTPLESPALQGGDEVMYNSGFLKKGRGIKPRPF